MSPQHAAVLRFGLFAVVISVLLALEMLWPRRSGPAHRALRWPANFGLTVIDGLLVAALSLSAFGAALAAQQAGFGLFNKLPAPGWLAGVVCWLVLDLAIYAQHRLLHTWPLLWPLHQPHHCDIAIDATTALRFHPGEILLSQLWKISLVAALGAPPAAVLAFEIALNACAMFNHANWAVRGDGWLRLLLVTPDMHRVHHSVHRDERDSNYGFCLSIWDRWLGSYRAQPRDGHAAMDIGLPVLRADADQGLRALLSQPLSSGRRSSS